MARRFGFGRRAHQDDGAGWIYADLFLALIIRLLKSGGRAAVVLDTLRHPLAIGDLHIWYERMQQLERDWFTPMLEALRHEHIGMLTLIDPNHTSQIQIETTRQDLRRFWRRIKPLTHYLPT